MTELKNNVLDINNNKLQQVIVEYVFVDSYNNLRSKTHIIYPTWINTQEKDNQSEKGKEGVKPIFNIDICMIDCSIIDDNIHNENKTKTNNTELFLVPRCLFNDPFNTSTEICKYLLCMCEIFNQDGKPYFINNRYKLYEIINAIGEDKIKEDEPLFSMQQEYFIVDSLNSNALYRNNSNNSNNSNNCCVGYELNYGRIIAMEHMNYCVKAGIKLNEIKSILGYGKWSYRIDFYSPFEICDNLWITRYILQRIGELHKVSIHFNIKLNSQESMKSSCLFFYVNFSNKSMRGDNGIHTIVKTIENIKLVENENNNQNDNHINNQNDNQIVNDYKIPMDIKLLGKGYFQYKTNKYNIDPYLICTQLTKSVYPLTDYV